MAGRAVLDPAGPSLPPLVGPSTDGWAGRAAQGPGQLLPAALTAAVVYPRPPGTAAKKDRRSAAGGVIAVGLHQDASAWWVTETLVVVVHEELTRRASIGGVGNGSALVNGWTGSPVAGPLEGSRVTIDDAVVASALLGRVVRTVGDDLGLGWPDRRRRVVQCPGGSGVSGAAVAAAPSSP